MGFKRYLRSLWSGGTEGSAENSTPAPVDAAALFESSWSQRREQSSRGGGSRTVGGCSDVRAVLHHDRAKLQQLNRADLKALTTAQLEQLEPAQLQRLAELAVPPQLGSARREGSSSDVRLQRVSTSTPASPRGTPPACKELVSCREGLTRTSSTGSAMLRRSSSTPVLPLASLQPADASQDSASSLHRSMSSATVAAAAAQAKAERASARASREGSTRSAAADPGNAGLATQPPAAAVQPPPSVLTAGRDHTNTAGGSGQQTPSGASCTATDCVSPTLSLLSVQLRSGSAANEPNVALHRMSALSHALSGQSSREPSARAGAYASVTSTRPEEPSEAAPQVHCAVEPELRQASWAKRMTKFAVAAPARSDSTGELSSAKSALLPPRLPGRVPVAAKGTLDPADLTAALRALADVGAPGTAVVLVGDCEFATAAAVDPLPSQGGPSGLAGGQSPASAGALQPGGLPMKRLQGSVAHSGPGKPTALADAAEAPSLPSSPPAIDDAATAAALAAATAMAPPGTSIEQQVWEQRFQKRWKAVRKRAFLQGLGIRSLWKVNSPSDRHEPLELLTNELPAGLDGLGRAPLSSARGCSRREGAGDVHRDPSLANMLLGEVAEVT